MIIAGDVEIPDKCPEGCRFKQEAMYQGNTCSRCPIFNCSKDDEGFCLVEPEDYRHEWALEWQKFFNGESEYPVLKLRG